MYETDTVALERAFATFTGELSETVKTCARIAINQGVERGAMKLWRSDMEEQVAFPTNYLKDPRRLNLAKKASNTDLEAVVVARERPTSLARFATSGSPLGNRTGGLNVRVKPGGARRMPGAFLMRLRAGASLTADNYNIGLAVRLKPGQTLNKTKSVQLDHNLHLLYGPSVDQVFRTVADEDSEQVADIVETEFWRQFDLREK